METRSCLIDLIEHSPDARFILVNNGSDRETERLLQDFAETLDSRALLLSTGSNRGIIHAINMGLQRAEAPFIGIMRSTCNPPSGWIEPLMNVARQRPEAGLLVPEFTPGGSIGKHRLKATREATTGSLHAMIIRKSTFDTVGTLDEELDGGFWCARDYSRRTYHAGYLTFAVDSPPILCRTEVPLGSQERREDTARRSAAIVAERWGKELAYCIWFPKGSTAATIRERWATLIKGARQGHFFSVIVPHAIYRELLEFGYDQAHENINIPVPPRFFADSAAGKELAAFRLRHPDAAAVAGIDGIAFPGVPQSLLYSDMEKRITDAERDIYHH